ncbi:STAS domain-containing protein [Cryptosporidium felis]|nr:STAS domain-containing protein [Cryptosporidium felis]
MGGYNKNNANIPRQDKNLCLTKEWDEFLSLYHLRNEEFNNDFKLHNRFHRQSRSGWRSFLRALIRSVNSFFLNESLIGIKYLRQAVWNWPNVICDLLCGSAEAALSIPQGLSYSSLANVLPSMGLCNGILQPIIYLFIGSSLYISIGVNSVESIVAGTAVDSLIGNGAPLEIRSEVCSVIIFFHGISCCLLRMFGLAHFVDFLSDSVLQGFLSGVAFSIIVKEVPFMLAIDPPSTNCVPVRALIVLFGKLSSISWQATIFSISTIFFLEVVIWIKSLFNTNFPVPSQLIVIIIANIASALASPNIPLIGQIPKSTLLIPNNIIWSQPPNVPIQSSNLSSLPFFARAWIAALPLTFISFFAHYSTAQSMEIRAHRNMDSLSPGEKRRKDARSGSKSRIQEKGSQEHQNDSINSLPTSVQLSGAVPSKESINLKETFVKSLSSSLKLSQGDIDVVQDYSFSPSHSSSFQSSYSNYSSSPSLHENERRISLSIKFCPDSLTPKPPDTLQNRSQNQPSEFEDPEKAAKLEESYCDLGNYCKTSIETVDVCESNLPKNENEFQTKISSQSSGKKKYIESRSLFSVGTEILVLGIINIVGAFFNCLPGAASLARTNLNFTLGVKSPLHNVAYSLGVFLVGMFLLDYIVYLPEAVLGAIITQAMVRMVNIGFFLKLVKMRSIDSFFWFIAFIGTVTTGITYGIIFALVSSVIYLIKFLYRSKFEVLGKLPGTLIFKSLEKFPQAVQLPYIRIVRFEGPLTFINADRFVRSLETMVEAWLEEEDLRAPVKGFGQENFLDEYLSKNQYFSNFTNSINFGERIPSIIRDLNENEVERVIIIDACMINEIDYTALQVLQRFNNQAKKLNIQIWFASFSHPNSSFLLRSGFYDIIPLVNCFVDLSEAVAAAQICIAQRHLQNEKPESLLS